MPAPLTKPRSRAAASHRRRSLKLFERDGFFHMRGTIREGRLKKRVRETTGIPYASANRAAAEACADRREAEVRGELGAGVPQKSLAESALDFMTRPKGEALGATDVAVIQELTVKFGMRRLRDIAPAEFISFVDDRMRGNAASTRERFINPLHALLTEAIRKGQYDEMPDFQRDKKARNPNRRARRKVANVRPYLLQLLIESAHIAIGAQICVEAATGGRVSSVLFGCGLEDFSMKPDAMQVTYHDTKNSDDVTAALPESTRSLLESFLAWRQLQVDAGRVSAARTAPLFLTPRGNPYKPNARYTGTRNKVGFNAAKRRALVKLKTCGDEAIAALEAAGDTAGAARARQVLAEDIEVLTKITQHWLRHKLATELGRLDLRVAMRQGGWRDVRSVQNYLIDDASFQRAAVEGRMLFETQLQHALFDTHLTREEADDGAK
jgi:hypothetical protein